MGIKRLKNLLDSHKKPINLREVVLRKKIGLICVLAFFLVIFGALSVYAEWINCSEYMAGICDQGGCDGDFGAGCILFGCPHGVLICMVRP